MVPTLHIHLLGDLHLQIDDLSITGVIPPRVRVLLAFLVLHCQVPQPRQRLAFLFWPDSSEGQARNNLRQSLFLLRQTLPHSEVFFQSDGQTVQWRPDAPFALDVADFVAAARQTTSVDSLRKAVRLYHGELLPGFYDEWILSERELIGRLFIDTLERLIGLLETQGDSLSAIRYSQDLLRSDPLREETYRKLIQLHGLRGNHAEALRIYQACVSVLKRELNVEPSAQTNAAYREVLEAETAPLHLAGSFPRSPANNLPKYLTSFIGRKGELEELERLFAPKGVSGTRLLTLTGTGGCGKTRLAIQLAGDLMDAFTDGVWFVDLAPLTDPALIPHTIASLWGLQQQSDRAMLETLSAYLQSRAQLLILDNCEHLAEACARLAESLLRACPFLRILATSREKLNLMGEVVWQVPALSLPNSNDLTPIALLRSDAIRLFVERASTVLPAFALTALNAAPVAQICQRLAGIPLAIELAAARIRMLTPAQIAARLDHAIPLLTQGGFSALSHHHTLRATMDWSFTLLSAKEQILFRRLSAFAGGFTLEAVEAICADNEQGGIWAAEVLDLLTRLTDKSLVNVMNWSQAAQARFRLLEPIWQYANEKLLESEDSDPLGSRHLEFFLNLAEEAEPHFSHAEQALWFNRLMADHDNLMTALDWSLKHNRVTAALRLTGAVWYFWLARGYYTDGVRRLMQALALTQAAAPSSPRAKALWAAGAMSLWSESDASGARHFLEEAVAMSRNLEDHRILAGSLGTLGAAALSQGDEEAARAFLTESLMLLSELNDRHTTGWSLTYLGDLSFATHDAETAQKLYAEAIEHFRALGDINSAGYAIRRLGLSALHQGDRRQAGQWIKESLALNSQVGYPQGIAACLGALAELALRQGRLVRAARLLGATEAQLDAVGGKLFPTDQTEYRATATALRAQLEETHLNSALAAGRAMKTGEAIEYALQVDEAGESIN